MEEKVMLDYNKRLITFTKLSTGKLEK